MWLKILLNKYVIGFALIALIASGAFYKGYTLAKDKADRDIAKMQLEAVRDVLRERERVSEVLDKVDEKLDELKANEKVIEREKIKIVDRPVYRNQCLDDDGVSLINKARVGKGPDTSSGEVQETLPDTP